MTPTKHPGTYVLILQSQKRNSIQIGKWGSLEIKRGYYAYIGSAFGPGGVLSRVGRHCRHVKKMHWHIDYLREALDLESIWFTHSGKRLEHEWATAIATLQHAQPVTGFGCTDCQCASHLYFFEQKPELSVFVRKAKSTAVQSCTCQDLEASA